MKTPMFKNRHGCILATIAASVALLFLSQPLTAAYKATKRNIATGTIYVYEDDATTNKDRRVWQVWVPDSGRPVRGLLVDGNPGTGDGRATTLNSSVQSFARQFNFGIMASAGVSGGSTYATHSFKIAEALEAMAALGDNPELVNVPFVTHGNSSAGANAYGLAMRFPERTICFTSNVIASTQPTSPPEDGMKVPGIIVVGEVDAVVPNSVAASRALMDYARPKGALWGRIVIQGMGHEHRRVMRLFYPMWEKCIRMRLPESWDPLSGPPTLLPVNEEDGWLVDDDSAVAGYSDSQPAADYDGDKTRMSWYLDADMAQLARGYAAYSQHGEFSIDEVHNYPGYNNKPDASAISQIMDHFRPGETVTLTYNPNGKAWQKVSFYYGVTLLGERAFGEEPTLTINLGNDMYAQAYMAVVTDNEGKERPLIGQGLLSLPGRDQWISARQFGWYYEGFAPWYYHAELGWLYPAPEEFFGRTAGFYFYYLDKEAWFWARPSWLPWIVDLSTMEFVDVSITPAP